MFSTAKKKVMAVAVMTTMLLAGFGAMAAQAHDVPACDKGNPAVLLHNPHCRPGHDHGNPGGNPGHDHDCEIISVEIDGIEVDVCVLIDVDIDIDHLLHVLHLLSLVDDHLRLEWLHGDHSLGEIDWLFDKIDLFDLFEKLHWLEPGNLFGLIGFIGHGAYDEGSSLLDLDLLDGIFDGGNGGGGSDCDGLVNVCNNANYSLNDVLDVKDVLDVCTISHDGNGGSGNGQGGNNNDCDVVDLSGGLLGLGDMGDSEWIGFLF